MGQGHALIRATGPQPDRAALLAHARATARDGRDFSLSGPSAPDAAIKRASSAGSLTGTERTGTTVFSLHSRLLKNPIASPEDRVDADVAARLLNDNLDRLRELADAVRFNWRHPTATPAWRAKAVHATWQLKRMHHAGRSAGWTLPLYRPVTAADVPRAARDAAPQAKNG